MGLPLPPFPYQGLILQLPQLMGDGRLRETQEGGQITNIYLSIPQALDHFKPTEITQNLEVRRYFPLTRPIYCFIFL